MNNPREREDLRYDLCRSLSLCPACCDWSLTQCTSNNPIESPPLADSDWLVGVELDNARISCRIFASRSGGSGDTLINVIDAANLKLCLLLRFFFVAKLKSGFLESVRPFRARVNEQSFHGRFDAAFYQGHYHPSACARCSICSKLGSVLLIQFRAWVICAGSTGTARGISSPLATSAPSYFTGFARLIGNFQ